MRSNMQIIRNKNVVVTLAAVVALIALVVVIRGKDGHQMISEFGKYQGYSEPVYDGSQRTSAYLTLSDGTRLAYDLIIPTKKGVAAAKPLPVLFKYTPYGRAWTIFDKQGNLLVDKFVDWPTGMGLKIYHLVAGDKARVMGPLMRDRWLGAMVKYGYIVVSVDRPGTGASFSSPTPGSMETAARFENEIIDWIAAQPWSDGNVGMYGDSQQAMVQFAAASAGNPHLKAIMPAASDIEIYQAVEYPGGVFNLAFDALWRNYVPVLDSLATPVDDDPNGVLLAQAVEQRHNQFQMKNASELAKLAPFLDSKAEGIAPHQIMDLYPMVDRINHSHTAIYMTVGWYDLFTADMFYWYDNLSVPRRLTVRPTDHSQVTANRQDLDYGVEAQRWFDYWLKGIDNGIMKEPAIHYYMQDGKKGSWQTADQWPLANEKLTAYYFAAGRSGSAGSVNDGELVTAAPSSEAGSDRYVVDYSTTTGPKSRWGAVEEAHDYPDLSGHDARALTYTSVPLTSELVVTGHPIAHVWLSTSAADLDTFVYLEVVDRNGKSTYITEGELRASHRKPGTAPFNNLGLPFQSHLCADQEPIAANVPFELTFALLPTSTHIQAGDRLRITVAFADAGNFDTPVLSPAPALEILRDASHASYVELPVVEER